MQIKNSYLKVIKPSKAKVGDLVYFLNNVINHVGILIDDSKIGHASENVMIENIQDVLDRLKRIKIVK